MILCVVIVVVVVFLVSFISIIFFGWKISFRIEVNCESKWYYEFFGRLIRFVWLIKVCIN